MRVVGLHPDVVVATSAGSGRRPARSSALRRARRSCVDSPVLPDELEAAARGRSSRPASRVSGLLATHARLGPPARPARVPGRRRSGCAETTAARLRGRAGRRPARAARVRRRALRRRARRRCRSGRSRRCRCPGKLELGDARARAAPGRGPHRRRHGDLGAVGAACSCAATTCRRSRSRWSADGRLARRLPGDARRAWSRCVEQADVGRARPRRAARRATRALAILREDRAYLEALRERGDAAPLPLARRDAARSARSTPRTRSDHADARAARARAAVRASTAALARLAADPPDLGRAASPAEVRERAGRSITPGGLGAEDALALFRDVLLATVAIDHPRYFAFIPSAPAPAAALADLLSAPSTRSTAGRGWRARAPCTRRTRRWLAAGLAGLPDDGRRLLRPGRHERQPLALHAARSGRAGQRGRRRGCASPAARRSTPRCGRCCARDGRRRRSRCRPTAAGSPATALRAALDADGDDGVRRGRHRRHDERSG